MMLDCLYSIFFSCFLAFISNFCQEHTIPPLKQSDDWCLWNGDTKPRETVKETCEKEEIWKLGCLSFVTFFKKILVYTVCKLKKHGFVTDITAT